MAIVDGAGRLTLVNDTFARLHGGTPEQLHGRHTLDVDPARGQRALGQAGLATGVDHPPVTFTAPAERGPVSYRLVRLGADTAMGLLIEAEGPPSAEPRLVASWRHACPSPWSWSTTSAW